MTQPHTAAALWGSAENRSYSTAQRLQFALLALAHYGNAVDRVEKAVEDESFFLPDGDAIFVDTIRTAIAGESEEET